MQRVNGRLQGAFIGTFVKSLFCSLLLTAAFCCINAKTLAQDESAGNSGAVPQAKQRDEAAVKDAIDGWWTAALPTAMNDWPGGARRSSAASFIGASIPISPANTKDAKGASYSEHIMRQLTIPRQEYLDEVVAKFNPEQIRCRRVGEADQGSRHALSGDHGQAP